MTKPHSFGWIKVLFVWGKIYICFLRIYLFVHYLAGPQTPDAHMGVHCEGFLHVRMKMCNTRWKQVIIVHSTRYHPKRLNAGMTFIGKSRIFYIKINIYNQNADMEYSKGPHILTGCQSPTHFVQIAITRSIYFWSQICFNILRALFHDFRNLQKHWGSKVYWAHYCNLNKVSCWLTPR